MLKILLCSPELLKKIPGFAALRCCKTPPYCRLFSQINGRKNDDKKRHKDVEMCKCGASSAMFLYSVCCGSKVTSG